MTVYIPGGTVRLYVPSAAVTPGYSVPVPSTTLRDTPPSGEPVATSVTLPPIHPGAGASWKSTVVVAFEATTVDRLDGAYVGFEAVTVYVSGATDTLYVPSRAVVAFAPPGAAVTKTLAKGNPVVASVTVPAIQPGAGESRKFVLVVAFAATDSAWLWGK